jgi:hypothetical protein
MWLTLSLFVLSTVNLLATSKAEHTPAVPCRVLTRHVWARTSDLRGDVAGRHAGAG